MEELMPEDNSGYQEYVKYVKSLPTLQTEVTVFPQLYASTS
jgi:hypothetical protein